MKIENSDNFFPPNYFLFDMSFRGMEMKLCKKVTLSNYFIIYECTDGRTHYYYGFIIYIHKTHAHTNFSFIIKHTHVVITINSLCLPANTIIRV